jgi:hypothetical protein
MPIWIESCLERRDKHLYQTYAVIKNHLQTQVQTRWCSQWPEGNDHGPTHIDRVLHNLGGLLGNDFETRTHPEVGTLELFLAMQAIVAHDIGMIEGRQGHAASSARLLATLALNNQLLFREHETNILQAVIRCHSSSVDLERECSRFAEREVFAGHSVRPKFVAALVRLSDELDEDSRRAEKWLQDLANLPEPSHPYWEFCQRIQGIDLDKPGGQIIFHAVFKPSDVGRTVRHNNQTISFLRFFAEKMAKINRERQLTGRYLGDLARHQLMVSVRPLEGVDNWTHPRVFPFTDGTLDPSGDDVVVDRFLQFFPELVAGDGGRRGILSGDPTKSTTIEPQRQQPSETQPATVGNTSVGNTSDETKIGNVTVGDVKDANFAVGKNITQK